MKSTLLERMVTKIDFSDSGCWIWKGARYKTGYGSIWVGENGIRNGRAHRVMYEMLVGPIPEGLTIDHLCRERLRVNPDHLEPVTPAENIRRQPSHNSLKTHCPAGHEYTPENTYEWHGNRYCRACHSSLTTRRYHERRGAA